LSTLTKVLIVLQVVVALVLCGLVVTYVATADNYKQMYEAERSTALRANQTRDEKIEEFEQYKLAKDRDTNDLNKRIADLEATITGLGNDRTALEREKAKLNETVTTMAAVVEAAELSAKQQAQLYQEGQKQLDALRAEQLKVESRIKETGDSLVEKMTIIGTQSEQIKRLNEEKTELQAKLDQTLRQAGKTVASPLPAQARQVVQQAGSLVRDLNLRGTITRVDLENSLAEISIGSADGVRQGMELYVTRGDRFMCKVLVLDVEASRAVGILELVQQSPKVGDTVATNL